MKQLFCRTAFSFNIYPSRTIPFVKLEDLEKTQDILCITDTDTMGYIKLHNLKTDKNKYYGLIINIVEDYEKGLHKKILEEIILIAKNEEGLKLLYKICSIAYANKNYFLQVSCADFLEFYDSQKLFCYSKTGRNLDFLKQIKDCFLGVSPLFSFINKNNIEYFSVTNKLLAISENLFINKEDYKYYEVLNTHRRIEANYWNRYLLTEEEWFNNPNINIILNKEQKKQALLNIDNVLTDIKPNISFPKASLPLLKEKQTLEVILFQQKNTAEEVIRLQKELETINSKQIFINYFFIVRNLIKFCEQNNIMVGPGRGSVGGSLVCKKLGITKIDPLKYGLLFERFLDKDRIDYPDIDLDFSRLDRPKLLKYFKKTYGETKVAKVGRLGNLQYKSLENNCKEFKRPIEEYLCLIDYPISFGCHPAGVVITQDEINNYGTVTNEDVLQVDVYDTDPNGLLKIDCLGIVTLDIIRDCLERIKNSKIDYNFLLNLSLDDINIYQYIFQKGYLKGVFQFEGENCRNDCLKIKPICFEDLVAITSITRTPLDRNIYIKKDLSRYKGQKLRSILQKTNGLLIYQEQIMYIVAQVFSAPNDIVQKIRKWISKLKKHLLVEYKEQLFSFNQENREEKEEAFNLIIQGSYSFNKSHAVAYSMLSYITAWLKYYYPVEFYCSLLDYEEGIENIQDINEEIKQVLNTHIYIQKEDFSIKKWTYKNNKFYSPISLIKGVTENTKEESFVKLKEKNKLETDLDFIDTYNKLKKEKTIPGCLFVYIKNCVLKESKNKNKYWNVLVYENNKFNYYFDMNLQHIYIKKSFYNFYCEGNFIKSIKKVEI